MLEKNIVLSRIGVQLFFYALLGLQEKACIYFSGLRKSGLQGDETLITFLNGLA